MAQNEYINKIIYGNQQIVDLTGVTVDESTLLQGYTAHSANGEPIIGTRTNETQVDRLVVTVNPNKINYHKYQSVDYTGIEITAYSPDGFEKVVTEDCTYIPVQNSILESSGTIPLTLRYRGKTTTVNVIVDNVDYIPSWSNGTDEEIMYALDRHYADDIDLTEHWDIGDERVIQMSATQEGSSGTPYEGMEAQPEQNLTMVLMNAGGKELVTPINGHTECAFIVGQKYTFVNTGMLVNANYNSYVWSTCTRRNWFNTWFRDALTDFAKSIFKLHINSAGESASYSTPVFTEDYFACIAEKEIFGTNTLGNADGEAYLSQFDYFKDASNRIKVNPSTGAVSNWHTRTIVNNNTSSGAGINTSGVAYTVTVRTKIGMIGFGVI